MFLKNTLLVAAACLVSYVSSGPVIDANGLQSDMFADASKTIVRSARSPRITYPDLDQHKPNREMYVDGSKHLKRHARSPGDGSLDWEIKSGKYGNRAPIKYRHNIFSSDDGRFSLDANAHASHNLDENETDFGAVLKGSWRF